jgi:hypothetical protein
MSNYPDDYNSHNQYCIRHNLYYHPVDGCPACEEEPAMLKHTIPEAKEALEQIIKVRESYEHRISVVEDLIADLQRELETLFSEHQDVESMERSIDYDIDCVLNDEPPDGHHINEMYDDEFIMPSMCPCDCPTCGVEASIKRWSNS